MAVILSTSGKTINVDDEDIELVSQYTWYAYGFRKNTLWYAVAPTRNPVTGKIHYIRMHRLLMGPSAGMVVDHINGNGLDNRRANLRIATIAQNVQSRHRFPTNTSGYRGVSFYRRKNKWQASIETNGKNINLGRFADKETAARVYDRAARELFGEFATLNFPENDTEHGVDIRLPQVA